MKKRKHRMPLLSALTVSMLYANFIATVSAHSIYQKYDTDGWSQPVISVLMQGLTHQSDVFAAQAIPAVSGSTPAGQSGSLASNGLQMDSQLSFEEVTQDYFDDALFIGDSRVTGIQLYSGWDNITYYAEGGMTIYSMFDCKAVKENGRTLTIEEALQERSFGKIYLEIGINEVMEDETGNLNRIIPGMRFICWENIIYYGRNMITSI